MTDRELIDYCEAHSRTPVGMIHRDMVKRVMFLATNEEAVWFDAREWWQVDADDMAAICKEARKTLERGDNGSQSNS